MTVQIPRNPTAMSAAGYAMVAAGVATTLVAGSARPVEGTEARRPTVTTTQAGAHTASFVASGRESYVASHPSGHVRTAVAKVNAERRRHGLRPYRYSVQLSAVALRWAHTLGRTQNLRHNPNLTSQVRSFRWVGENVGYGPNVAVTHGAFMASPAHRANVLDRDYTQIGLSVVKDSHGRYWEVQVFRDPQ